MTSQTHCRHHHRWQATLPVADRGYRRLTRWCMSCRRRILRWWKAQGSERYGLGKQKQAPSFLPMEPEWTEHSQEINLTLSALGPLGPASTVKPTWSPSPSVPEGTASRADRWTNTSPFPSSRAMNPKLLAGSYHFTVPVISSGDTYLPPSSDLAGKRGPPGMITRRPNRSNYFFRTEFIAPKHIIPQMRSLRKGRSSRNSTLRSLE